MNRLSLKSKFTLLLGLVFVLLLSAIGTGLYGLKSLSTTLHEVNNKINPISHSISSITKAQLNQSVWFERALRARQDFTTTENIIAYSEALNLYANLSERITEHLKAAIKQANIGAREAKEETTIQEFRLLKNQLEQLKKNHSQYEVDAIAVFETISSGVPANLIIQKITEKGNELNEEVAILFDEVNRFSSTTLSDAEALEVKAERLVWATSGFGVLIGLLFSVLIVRNILAQIGGEPQVIAELSSKVASGQLDMDTSHFNETTGIHHSTLKMAIALSGVIANVIQNAKEVEVGSTQLVQTSGDVAAQCSGMNQQTTTIASAAEELSVNVASVADEASTSSEMITNISASVEELSTNINTIAAATEEASANMSQVSSNISDISGETQTVKESVDSMSSTMTEINENAAQAKNIASNASQSAVESLDIMSDLSDMANRIGRIVKMIANIASQTNMLSLNATIEATNAGAAGKGFAVVAQEVKQLAQESAEASSEVAEAITQVQNKISSALDRTKDVNSVIHKMVDVFEEISTEISQQNKRTLNIATALDSISNSSQGAVKNVEEAALGVKEITRSVAQASQAARESANNIHRGSDSVKMIASSSKELSFGIDEINQSMKHIQSSAYDLSGEMQASKTTAQELQATATSLEKLVSYFKLG